MTDTISIKSTVELMYISHATDINNISISQGLKLSVILYVANQSMDPQL